MRSRCYIIPGMVAALLFGGCGKESPVRGSSEQFGRAEARVTPAHVPGRAEEPRRAELLSLIRAADPRQETIQRALLNENNELGLILSRQTNLDDVPRLLR